MDSLKVVFDNKKNINNLVINAKRPRFVPWVWSIEFIGYPCRGKIEIAAVLFTKDQDNKTMSGFFDILIV